jgi:hypothetical protein
MATTSKLYVGDVGRELFFDCVLDISGATAHDLEVMKPKATSKVVWTATVYGTHMLKYVTVAGDLSVDGDYLIQPRIALSAPSTLDAHCETATVTVYPLFG